MKKILKILVYAFALIGFVLSIGYIALRLHLTNSKGIIDGDQSRFLKNYREMATISSNSADANSTTASTSLAQIKSVPENNINSSWTNGSEWQIFKEAVMKDIPILNQVEKNTGISSRLIVAQLLVEQLRLYYSNREIFKQIFEPLKILGSQSQFSWGVMGIKQKTAVEIENNLKDSASAHYPGAAYEHLLDFKTDKPDEERFNRIISESDHYYSYLYTALYIKEIEAQWYKAGFDISKRPEILSTLFNIGFEHSHPNSNPQVGGAEININGKIYSFGGLAYDFYYSKELLDYFPRR